jgi:hypothetical protein
VWEKQLDAAHSGTTDSTATRYILDEKEDKTFVSKE